MSPETQALRDTLAEGAAADARVQRELAERLGQQVTDAEELGSKPPRKSAQTAKKSAAKKR